MRMLVLGGTAWLGREVAAAAGRAGWEVTCLARGVSGDPPPGARFVVGDRGGDAYAGLAGERFDAAVDVARQPGHVRRAAEAMAGRVGHYVFVSSCSVYADHAAVGADESAAVLPALDSDVMPDMSAYGAAKVACEQHVRAAFGERALIARVSLVGGPGDWSDRSVYYPARFAAPAGGDGAVLVPDIPDQLTQAVDVRDLAAWLVAAAAARVAGVLNVGGETVPLAAHLAVARQVAGHAGPVVAVPEAWLAEHGVGPWMGPRSLPLWLPPEHRGMNSRDCSRARAAGLVTRPLAETLRDALAWARGRPADHPWSAGLTPAQERELLAAAAR